MIAHCFSFNQWPSFMCACGMPGSSVNQLIAREKGFSTLPNESQIYLDAHKRIQNRYVGLPLVLSSSDCHLRMKKNSYSFTLLPVHYAIALPFLFTIWHLRLRLFPVPSHPYFPLHTSHPWRLIVSVMIWLHRNRRCYATVCCIVIWRWKSRCMTPPSRGKTGGLRTL